MVDDIRFRVKSKSFPGEWYWISVQADGSDVECDCGMGFCSHIDATLVAGERAMVHPDDLAQADEAGSLMLGCLEPPSEWKASWRKNLRWRGLSQKTHRVRDKSKPLVCFTGTLDRPRAELIAEAKEAGWEVIGAPSKYTDVLVAEDPMGGSRKLVAARAAATPIVSLEEWMAIMTDGVLASD